MLNEYLVKKRPKRFRLKKRVVEDNERKKEAVRKKVAFFLINPPLNKAITPPRQKGATGSKKE